MKFRTFYYKRFLLSFFFIFIVSAESFAQVSGNRIQKGIVRLQSFVGQNIRPVSGAVISTSLKGTNNASSDENGRFRLSLIKLSNDRSPYQITSVRPPKGSINDLELMQPLTTDILEYTTHDLVIVMSSKTERDAYVKHEVAKVKEQLDRKYGKKIKELEERFNRGELERTILLDSLTQYQKVLDNQDKWLEAQIKRMAEQTDFETCDSCNKAVALALHDGDIDHALLLLNKFESYYDQLRKESINEKKLSIELEASSRRKDRQVQENAQNWIKAGYLNSDFTLIKKTIQKELYYDPLSVDYLIQMGQLEELIYNNYSTADSLYHRALMSAISKNENADRLADICNKLADVYYMQSKYDQAEEFYRRALDYLKTKNSENSKAFYDAHAGIGKLRETFGFFDEAETYYKCLIDDRVRSVSRRAHFIGNIGIAQLLFERGRLQEAEKKFESLIQSIDTDGTIELDLRVLAYMDYVECLHAFGRYNKAIELCDTMINYVQSHSVGANYYMSEILIHRAMSLCTEGRLREAKEDMNHSMEICQNIFGEEHPKYALLYAHIASFSQTMGDMEHAKEFADKALLLFDQKFGKHSLHSVSAYLMLINCYINSGDYDKALKTIELVYKIYQDFGINNQLWFANLKLAQASIDEELGNHKQAEQLINEVINTYCSLVGSDYVNLISLYNKKGNMAKTATKMYEWYAKAEKLTAKIWGEDSKQMIMQRITGANKYFADGAFLKYEKVCLDAEKICLEAYEGDNYNMVFLFDRLSSFYEKMREYNKSENYRIRAYETTKRTFGDSHPYLAIQETSLGTFYLNTGKYEEGKKLIIHADSILTNKFGVNHKNTFQSQLALCSALASMGKFEEALTHIEDLRKNVLAIYGKDNLFYSNIIGYYSAILNTKGETKKAIQYAKEILSIYEKNEINDRATLIDVNNQISTYYINIGDLSNAIRYNEIALELANDYYGKNAFGTMHILFSKANLLSNQKETIAEAKQLFHKVYKAYTEKYGTNSPETFSIDLVIASMKMLEGNFEEGVIFLEEIKGYMETGFGKESTNLCKVLDALGNAYLHTDSIDVGLNLLERSLDILESYYGHDSHLSIEPLSALCNAYMNNGDITKAKLYATRASQIAGEFYGYDSPLYTSIDAKYGVLMLQEGNTKSAYSRIDRYNKIMKEAVKDGRVSEYGLCESYAYLAQYYQVMAMIDRNNDDNIKAERNAKQALTNLYEQHRIISAFLGEESANNIGCLSALANTYGFIQEADSAIVYAQNALDLTLMAYGDNSIQTASAYIMLASVNSIKRDALGNIPLESLCMSESYLESALDIYKNIFSKNKNKFVQNSFMTRVNLSDIKASLFKHIEVLALVNQLLEDIEFLPNADNRLLECKLLLTKASAYANSFDKKQAPVTFEEALRSYNALPFEAKNSITMYKHQVAIIVYFFLRDTKKWNDECNAYLTYLKHFPNTESLQQSFLEYMKTAESQLEAE